ncbi:hypothetical protein GO491_04555 [Flavobacteriaceae bacterium Ap0902]|nr:hypothetical protein [Flavobacteriaceae bacterium Ap0902]
MQNDYTSVYNGNKTLILYYKIEQTRSDPAKHFTYFVERVSDGLKIYEDTFRGENIAWYDNQSLVLTPYVGIIQKPDDSLLNGNGDVKKETTKNNNKQIIKIN